MDKSIDHDGNIPIYWQGELIGKSVLGNNDKQPPKKEKNRYENQLCWIGPQKDCDKWVGSDFEANGFACSMLQKKTDIVVNAGHDKGTFSGRGINEGLRQFYSKMILATEHENDYNNKKTNADDYDDYLDERGIENYDNYLVVDDKGKDIKYGINTISYVKDHHGKEFKETKYPGNNNKKYNNTVPQMLYAVGPKLSTVMQHVIEHNNDKKHKAIKEQTITEFTNSLFKSLYDAFDALDKHLKNNEGKYTKENPLNVYFPSISTSIFSNNLELVKNNTNPLYLDLSNVAKTINALMVVAFIKTHPNIRFYCNYDFYNFIQTGVHKCLRDENLPYPETCFSIKKNFIIKKFNDYIFDIKPQKVEWENIKQILIDKFNYPKDNIKNNNHENYYNKPPKEENNVGNYNQPPSEKDEQNKNEVNEKNNEEYQKEKKLQEPVEKLQFDDNDELKKHMEVVTPDQFGKVLKPLCDSLINQYTQDPNAYDFKNGVFNAIKTAIFKNKTVITKEEEAAILIKVKENITHLYNTGALSAMNSIFYAKNMIATISPKILENNDNDDSDTYKKLKEDYNALLQQFDECYEGYIKYLWDHGINDNIEKLQQFNDFKEKMNNLAIEINMKIIEIQYYEKVIKKRDDVLNNLNIDQVNITQEDIKNYVENNKSLGSFLKDDFRQNIKGYLQPELKDKNAEDELFNDFNPEDELTKVLEFNNECFFDASLTMIFNDPLLKAKLIELKVRVDKFFNQFSYDVKKQIQDLLFFDETNDKDKLFQEFKGGKFDTVVNKFFSTLSKKFKKDEQCKVSKKQFIKFLHAYYVCLLIPDNNIEAKNNEEPGYIKQLRFCLKYFQTTLSNKGEVNSQNDTSEVITRVLECLSECNGDNTYYPLSAQINYDLGKKHFQDYFLNSKDINSENVALQPHLITRGLRDGPSVRYLTPKNQVFYGFQTTLVPKISFFETYQNNKVVESQKQASEGYSAFKSPIKLDDNTTVEPKDKIDIDKLYSRTINGEKYILESFVLYEGRHYLSCRLTETEPTPKYSVYNFNELICKTDLSKLREDLKKCDKDNHGFEKFEITCLKYTNEEYYKHFREEKKEKKKDNKNFISSFAKSLLDTDCEFIRHFKHPTNEQDNKYIWLTKFNKERIESFEGKKKSDICQIVLQYYNKILESETQATKFQKYLEKQIEAKKNNYDINNDYSNITEAIMDPKKCKDSFDYIKTGGKENGGKENGGKDSIYHVGVILNLLDKYSDKAIFSKEELFNKDDYKNDDSRNFHYRFFDAVMDCQENGKQKIDKLKKDIFKVIEVSEQKKKDFDEKNKNKFPNIKDKEDKRKYEKKQKDKKINGDGFKYNIVNGDDEKKDGKKDKENKESEKYINGPYKIYKKYGFSNGDGYDGNDDSDKKVQAPPSINTKTVQRVENDDLSDKNETDKNLIDKKKQDLLKTNSFQLSLSDQNNVIHNTNINDSDKTIDIENGSEYDKKKSTPWYYYLLWFTIILIPLFFFLQKKFKEKQKKLLDDNDDANDEIEEDTGIDSNEVKYNLSNYSNKNQINYNNR